MQYNYVRMLMSNGFAPTPGRTQGQQNSRPPANAPPQVETVTGVTIMLTFWPVHSDWNEKYGPSRFGDIDSAATCVAQEPELALISGQVEQWVQDTILRTVPDLWYYCKPELAPECWSNGEVKLHMHIECARKGHKALQLPASLRYHVERIHFQVNRVYTSVRNVATVVNRAFYYVYMPKPGSLSGWGNYEPRKNFNVPHGWITDYRSQNKLSVDKAVSEYLLSVDRAKMLIDNLMWIENKKRDVADEAARLQTELKIRASLQKIQMPLCWFKFMKQYDGENNHRFMFWVCYGPSKCRKSVSIRCQFPIGALLELNCSGGVLHPDFTQLKVGVHKAILCDEGTPQMVLKHKVEFQATNAPCTLGCTTTNQFAYSRRFYRIPMIIACNNWNEQLKLIDDAGELEWLKENAMVYYCHMNSFKPRDNID